MFINLKNGSEALIPNARASGAVKFTISAISAPATNDLNSLPFLSGPPVKMTALISSFASISLKHTFNSSRVSLFNALSAAGLEIARTAIPSATSSVKFLNSLIVKFLLRLCSIVLCLLTLRWFNRNTLIKICQSPTPSYDDFCDCGTVGRLHPPAAG